MHERLFFALPVRPDDAAAIDRWASPMRDQVETAWVAPEQYHVTLAFLGETTNDLIPEIIDYATEHLDTGLLPIDWTVNHVSRFRAGVLYLSGFQMPVAMSRFAQALSFFVPLHERHLNFIPHITLARRAPDVTPPSVDMTLRFDRVTLFSSSRATKSSSYRKVHEWVVGDGST